MKRPKSIDCYNTAQKNSKLSGNSNSHRQSFHDVSSPPPSQGLPFVSSVPPPPTLQCQNRMPPYYMTNPTSYYSGIMSSQDNLYSHPQLGLNTWQMPQTTPPPQPMFDTTRPPPPPLPKTPAPEKPPLPPLPPTSLQDKKDSLPMSSNNYYRSRGGYNSGYRRGGYGKFRGGHHNRGAIPPSSTSPPVASQPPPSGLLIKSPAILNGQITPIIENAKQHRFKTINGINGMSGHSNDCDRPKNQPIVHKKKRRKPMSERLPTLEWKREDAQRVLELEKEYHAKRGDKAVIVRFPDPKLDYEVVKGFSSSIESVHFQQPAAARSCIIHLKKGSDVKKVVEDLNKTSFGQGFISAEPKRDEIDDEELAVEDIDPYTLYIGNFPSDVNVDEVKAMFPTAKKVDVGYAQKMKVTRYGFARYTNVNDAIQAYKANFNALYKSRSIIVRFRRNNRSIGLDGDRKGRKKEDRQRTEKKEIMETNDDIATASGNITFDSDGDGENNYEYEDNKDRVFDFTNNFVGNWYSDDMYESDEEEELPNLTGIIKNEPDDFVNNVNEDNNFSSTERLHQKRNKENTTTTASPNKFNDKNTDRVPTQKNINTINLDAAQNKNKSNPPFRRSYPWPTENWEDIRQRELNEREEKPDIGSLNLGSPTSQQPSHSNNPPPITKYGLVPMILPKQEQDVVMDDQTQNEKETDKDFEDFGNSLEQEDDVDAAFENAWNELSGNGS